MNANYEECQLSSHPLCCISSPLFFCHLLFLSFPLSYCLPCLLLFSTPFCNPFLLLLSSCPSVPIPYMFPFFLITSLMFPFLLHPFPLTVLLLCSVLSPNKLIYLFLSPPIVYILSPLLFFPLPFFLSSCPYPFFHFHFNFLLSFFVIRITLHVTTTPKKLFLQMQS